MAVSCLRFHASPVSFQYTSHVTVYHVYIPDVPCQLFKNATSCGKDGAACRVSTGQMSLSSKVTDRPRRVDTQSTNCLTWTTAKLVGEQQKAYTHAQRQRERERKDEGEMAPARRPGRRC